MKNTFHLNTKSQVPIPIAIGTKPLVSEKYVDTRAVSWNLEFGIWGLGIILLLLTSCGVKKTAAGHSVSYVKKKYSRELGVSEAEISNEKLYSFIDDWLGTPYKYAGKSKSGTDCSGFVSVFYKEIYGRELSGPSYALYRQTARVNADELREGDLVFFRIESSEITHVGIYLRNNRFVHASSKAGVTIEDLSKEYYRKYFAGGGRVK